MSAEDDAVARRVLPRADGGVRASGEEAAALCGGEGDERQDGRLVSRESLDAFVRLRGIVDLDGFVHRPRRDASVG